MSAVTKVQTSLAEYSYDIERKLLCIHILADEIEPAEVLLLKEQITELTNGNPSGLFVSFANGFAHLSPEAREQAAALTTQSSSIATAICVSSLSLRLLINSYIFFNKPATPTKMFNNKKRAIEWLLEKIENKKA